VRSWSGCPWWMERVSSWGSSPPRQSRAGAGERRAVAGAAGGVAWPESPTPARAVSPPRSPRPRASGGLQPAPPFRLSKRPCLHRVRAQPLGDSTDNREQRQTARVATPTRQTPRSWIGGVQLRRIPPLLPLVLVSGILLSRNATALLTAGYLRDEPYGKFYAKLTEPERVRGRGSSDSVLGPIGRNRPGRVRPSARRLSVPAPPLSLPVR